MLKINNLHVSYGQILALRGIDLEVRDNQIISLIGANGAGKTTLLKTISGLLKPNEGTITFCDENITSTLPNKIVEKGLIHVPEGRQIFSGLTVEENILLGAYTRKDKKNIKHDIEKLYEKFPILKERKNQNAHTLSGGEQQMLAICRALMSKPKLLLLDEPSMGLAPLIVNQIFDIIKEINKDGTPILLIEQNAKKALQVSHYSYIIEGGKIRLHGYSKDLLNSDDVRKIYLGDK